MIGLTIGIGPHWSTLAHQSAARMSEMTGLPCHVVEHDPYNCCHPSWLKCHLHRMFPAEDSFLIFDADILAARVREMEHPLLLEVVRLIGEGRLSLRDGRIHLNGKSLHAPLQLGANRRLA